MLILVMTLISWKNVKVVLGRVQQEIRATFLTMARRKNESPRMRSRLDISADSGNSSFSSSSNSSPRSTRSPSPSASDYDSGLDDDSVTTDQEEHSSRSDFPKTPETSRKRKSSSITSGEELKGIPFATMKRIAQQYGSSHRFTAGAINCLRQVADEEIQRLLVKAAVCARFSGHKTVGLQDMKLVLLLQQL
ncbi:unnamed protein product [Caenorhabditis auriculariae]|uniref:Transcription factor CBF/NF-Y/archaeal histone domain-containing protein n=1 Tax=Caenorhabditis auriculariae TaxID=2777116 RepID=A0A8S1HJE5_9PELO|nr:unnamed protein product [Caenorhabditis auriculariae]